jgi:hypothetical protein
MDMTARIASGIILVLETLSPVIGPVLPTPIPQPRYTESIIHRETQHGGDVHTPLADPRNATEVLGIATSMPVSLPLPTLALTPTPDALPSPEPTSTKRSTKTKRYVSVALLGDSMTDTLGPDAPELKNSLKRIYPNTTVTIRNFGVGGENIESAINRITHSYTYLGIQHQSVASFSPDLVIIESCGYNPFPVDGALNRHWLDLAKAVDTVKTSIPHAKILISVTIAPNALVFGDGAAGLSFGPIDKWQRVNVIKTYLENAVRFAKGEKLPLADAYHRSLESDGNGKLSFINPGDHIHYSNAGRVYMGQILSEAINANDLFAE